MSGHSNMQLASETTSGDLGGTYGHPNKAFAGTQLTQQFELDQDELEDHEGDTFFYEFDIKEEYRRLEMMKEFEKRRIWAQHHQLSEDEEDEGGEGEGEETSASLEYAIPEGDDECPGPWGSFDWRVCIAEYILEYGQEEEPLSPGRAAEVDQVLSQSFPGIRQYYEEHLEEYSAGLNSDLGVEP